MTRRPLLTVRIPLGRRAVLIIQTRRPRVRLLIEGLKIR